MKLKKLLLVIIVLLALLTFGGVNAAENMTADDLTVSDSGENYMVQQVDENNGQFDDAVFITNVQGNANMSNNELHEGNNVVTAENLDKFFDDEGTLKDEVNFDELIFKGEFNGPFEKFLIVKPLTITGDGAILKNVGVKISSDDVILDNLTFISDTSLGSLIYIEGSNVGLINLNVIYSVGSEESVAIDMSKCSDVNLLNSTVFFESHVIDDTKLSLAIQAVNTQNVVMDRNNITTKLPCVYVNTYDEDYNLMGSNKVNPVRLKDCNNLKFTNNNVNSTTNNFSAKFPTIQSIYIIGCSDSLIDHNNISMIDEMTPSGMDNYLYGIDFGYNSNVTFSYNNFNMSTKGGKYAAGSAYAFQGVQSDVIIKGNNITSISNGPNLGIYVASMYGEHSELLIEDNFINVTGSASISDSWALVSDIEIQNGDAKIYNNTIYTQNVIDYQKGAYIYGISYAQRMYGDRSFDIQNNTVYTEGTYTISVINSTSFYADGNTLHAHDLVGDDSINPGITEDVTIGENSPLKLAIHVEDSWLDEDNKVNITVLNPGGNLTIKVNGKELVSQQVLVDNTFNYIISLNDLIFGENTIEAIYNNSVNNEISSISKTPTFNVIGYVNPNLTIEVENITIGHVAVVNVTINHNAVGVLNVSVNGKDYPVTINGEGKGQVSITDLDPKTYTATAIFESANLRYVSSEANTTFKVAKLESKIDIDIAEASIGQNTIVNVSIQGATGNVTIIVDGKKENIPLDENGNATYTIEDIAAGDHGVVVVYLGDESYAPAVESTTVSVDKLTPTISIAPIDVQYVGKVITITVTNDTAVDVTINGKGYTLSNGVITIENGLGAGEYIVVASTAENDKYHAGSDSTTFTVVKDKSEVGVTADSEVKLGMETTITVDVTDGATGTVIVNVNGTEYAINLTETNTLTVAFDKAGEYSVVATYGGNDKYNASKSEKATIVVSEKQAANVKIEIPDEIKVGDKIIINVTADSDAEIIVYINGEAQTFLLQGSPLGASLNDVLTYALDKKVAYDVSSAGVYNITVIAKENDDYASQVVTKIFEATRKDAELNITPITDAKVGDNVTIKVDKDTDGALTITVNGEDVTGEFEITKPAAYTVVAKSAATDSYNAGFETYTFNVEESAEPQTNITVVVDGKEYTAEIINGIPTVNTDPNNNITVVVDGKEYNATVVDGRAVVTTDSVELNNNITVVVDGKEYNATVVDGRAVVTTGPVEQDNNVTVIINGESYPGVIENGTVVIEVPVVEPDNNVTVVVNGESYPGVIENGTVVIEVPVVEPDSNVTVVVNGESYPGVVVNGTVVIEIPVDNNITVVVDGKEYPAEVIDGKAVVTLDPVDNNITVVVDGVSYPAELINGTAVVTLDPETNITVVVDGKEYTAEIINGTPTVTTDPVIVPRASEFSEITISDTQSISIVLKDADGNVIANAPITFTVNGAANSTTTDNDGKFVIQGENGAVITINYAGNDSIVGTNITLKLNSAAVPEVVKVAAQFNISDRAITINGYAVDGPAGEQGIYYATTLLDANGKPISNVYLEFAVNNKIYNRTTYENGSFNPYKLNMIRAGRYTMAFNFAGDENYTNAFACVCVDLDKKPITIKAPAKTYKAAAKTKKYTATLSTIPSVYDGKVYLSPKAVKLTVNGKTFTGKTNSNGQVTFKITNLNKKGKYTATISYKGDKTYEEATQKVKLTIK